MPSIAQLLEQSRRELLELGLRNTLLNYRLTKGRGIEIVGAVAEQVFERLVRAGEEVTFAPAGTERTSANDSILLTAHDDNALQSRLLGSYYAARTHIEERGVNILFLAIGMLHWFEEESSQRELKAPLLLVPVELNRTSAREKFKVRYSDEDVEGNASLEAKLADYSIKYPPLPDIEDLDVTAYFTAIEKEISGQHRWRVERNEIALGFFSFSKFLMYRDLDPAKWCTPDNPDASPLLSGLLRDGFRGDGALIGEDAYLDKVVAPNVLKQVMDADSSQALAMLDVRSGRNLVIQGPPGTGKSQTITNLIADALGAGKRVLFVAEKSTALDVVKRRLDKVNLGDACLELHSHSANKKAVLAELQRTIRLGRPRTDAIRWSLEQFKNARDQLNAYCLAVNTPVGDTNWTPHQIMGELLKVTRIRAGVQLPSADSFLQESDLARIRAQSREQMEAKQEHVQQLQSHLQRMGRPADHPFRCSRLDAMLPSDRSRIEVALTSSLTAIEALNDALRELAEFMHIAAQPTRQDAEVLARAARRALGAPHLKGIELRTGDWAERRDDIAATLEAGRAHSRLREKFDQILIPEAWDQDLLQTRQVLNTTGRKWWRWFSSEYRGVRKRVAGLCTADHPRDVATQLDIVDAIMQCARLRKQISEHEALMARLFGVQWQGLRSDWAVLARLTEWVVDLYRELGDGHLPSGIIDFLAGAPALDALKQKVNVLEAALPVFDARLPELASLLAYAEESTRDLLNSQLPEQLSRLKTMLVHLDDLSDIIRLNNLRTVLAQESLQWVLDAAWEWHDASTLLVQFYRQACLEPLLRAAYEEREALRRADGKAQATLQEAFRNLDVLSLKATQLELASQHHAGLPAMNGMGQIGVLAREFQKRARHFPIRKLVSEAGNAIAAIKPVFMMSPMSVAAFIPPKTLHFDLVIFDEASQVKPVDGFGAILRGSQVVVVGDSKQLPPTSFFDSLVSGSDEDEEDAENIAADVESILGLAMARGVPERMLRWHYRSRHHSLIELSNSEFYDNRLVVFPSPEPNTRRLGLHFHHLPKTTYDRGRTRTNRLEAQIVAKAVMLHAKSTPDLTLGVAAFSLQQADAIIDEVEQLRRADPSVETFFNDHSHEPFFVKNLESVQGDERDVIFISVGYGRTEEGFIPANFGALNRAGGERRLNVLITRARRSCEVFSNLTDDDIDLSRSSSRGVAALKAFLKYARTGIADVPNAGEVEADSPFEEEVASALRAHGHDVVMQVGSGGFRIDLGVRDTKRPGRYLIGIECDGAAYHSSRSARDRDRLRQQVLEGLGWRIHRIWSTDWFHNPEREVRRALAAIEQAQIAAETAVAPAVKEPGGPAEELPREPEREKVEAVESPCGVPYEKAILSLRLDGLDLHEISPRRMAPWVAQVVAAEGPVHRDEVARRIAQAAGVQRVGARIDKAIRAGIEAAAASLTIRVRGDFLWPSKPGRPSVRDRSGLESSSRKIELVAPEEVDVAILEIVRASLGIHVDLVPSATCRMLGFARTSEDMADVIHQRLERLCRLGQLERDVNGHITLGAKERAEQPELQTI